MKADDPSSLLRESSREVSRDKTVFVGLARNCQHALPDLLNRVAAIGNQLTDWGYVFLESDSDDATLAALQAFHGQHDRGQIDGLGRLKLKLPRRTERLAQLRNECLRRVFHDPRLSGFDYCIVLDMDWANESLDAAYVVNLLRKKDRAWDALFANQEDRYYDIWALRHPRWSPDDCWKRVRERAPGMSREEAEVRFVESRQITVARDAPLIEVDSAFGGFGIYDLNLLRGCSYVGLDEEGDEQCEHVALHAQLRAAGGRLFIDPALINGRGTQSHRAAALRRARHWLQARLFHRFRAA